MPFPSPGDLPSSRIEPVSPALPADSLPTEAILVLRWCRIRLQYGRPGLGRYPEEGFQLQFLAWRIPWTEEPGGLQSIGLQRDTMSDFQFTSLHIGFHKKVNRMIKFRNYKIHIV